MKSTHIICAIFDTKAEKHFAPNILRTEAEFIRSVQIETNNPESMLSKFAADYDLVILGEWSEDIGILPSSEPYRKRLGSALDYKSK